LRECAHHFAFFSAVKIGRQLANARIQREPPNMLKLRVLHLNNNLLKLINLIAGKREHPRLILREIHFIIMIDLGWIVVFKNDHNRKAIR
jgi:hypothetical protein